jgi:hypothetical protein
MSALYDADILLWSEQQAALLRRLAHGERVDDSIDWQHLIDEVEAVGRSQLGAVESQLRVALWHILLIHAAPGADGVPHWRGEAIAALGNAATDFAPSMAQRMDLPRLWRMAQQVARNKLANVPGAAANLPDTMPYALDDLVAPEPDLDALLARLAG